MQLELLPDPASNTGLNSQSTLLLPDRIQLTASRSRSFSFEIQELKASSLSDNKSDNSVVDDAPPPHVGVDNLTFLWDEKEGFDILPYLKELLRVEFDFTTSRQQRIGVLWDYIFTGTLNSLYMFRRTKDGLRYRLSISGKACAAISHELLLRFLQVLLVQNPAVICSRIDTCLDDFSKRLSRDTILSSLRSGHYSGFQKWLNIENGGEATNGWTINLGSRESEHFTRIYDKDAESGGRVKSIRWESEYKNGKADAIYRSLAGALDMGLALRMLRGYVFGNIEFKYRTDKNLSRCKQVEWWAEFLSYTAVERCKFKKEKVESTLYGRIHWVHKQVEKTLALLHKAFGFKGFFSFVKECVMSGTDRLKNADNIILKNYLDLEFGDDSRSPIA